MSVNDKPFVDNSGVAIMQYKDEASMNSSSAITDDEVFIGNDVADSYIHKALQARDKAKFRHSILQ